MTKDLTVGNPYKLIVGFAVPVFLSELFQQLYTAIDSLIVGRCLGTSALAAVSASGPLIFLMTGFFIGMFMGAGVVISNFFGAGEYEKTSRSIHTSIAFGLIVGVVLTAVGVLLSDNLLLAMKTDPEVYDGAVTYFKIYFCGSLPMTLYNVNRSVMNAVGDSKRPLYYLMISSCLNVILDLTFIRVFHMGVGSAAAATVISQSVSAILSSLHLLKKGHVFSVSISRLRIEWEMLRRILRYGLPSGIQNSVISIANVVVQTQINSFGKFATAAFGAHSKIQGFAFLPITSFNMAVTTYISQNLGAKQYDRAKKGARFTIISSLAIAELIGITYYFFAPQLIGLFDGTAQVLHYGLTEAHIETLFYCLLAFSHTIAAICRGSGKAKVPMFVMLAVWCVFRIIYIEVTMHVFGDIRFVYWAYPITWSISSIIFLLYYKFSDWVHGFEHH